MEAILYLAALGAALLAVLLAARLHLALGLLVVFKREVEDMFLTELI